MMLHTDFSNNFHVYYATCEGTYAYELILCGRSCKWTLIDTLVKNQTDVLTGV